MTVQGWHQVARRGPGHRTSACLKGTRSPDISLFEGDSVTGHQSARKGSGHRTREKEPRRFFEDFRGFLCGDLLMISGFSHQDSLYLIVETDQILLVYSL